MKDLIRSVILLASSFIQASGGSRIEHCRMPVTGLQDYPGWTVDHKNF